MRVLVLVDDRELWMPVVVTKVVFHQRVECQTVFLTHASMEFSMMPCHLTISIHVQSDYRKFQLINQFRKCLFPKALENSMNFRRNFLQFSRNAIVISSPTLSYRKFWRMRSQRYRWNSWLCIVNECHAWYLSIGIRIAAALI